MITYETIIEDGDYWAQREEEIQEVKTRNGWPNFKWEVGRYSNARSVWVSVQVDDMLYVARDDGISLLPRWWRLGRAVAELEKRSGLLGHLARLKSQSGLK